MNLVGEQAVGTFAQALRKLSQHRGDLPEVTVRVERWNLAPVLWLRGIFDDYDRELPTTRERFATAVDHDLTLLRLLLSCYASLIERLRGLNSMVSSRNFFDRQHTKQDPHPLFQGLQRSIRSDPGLEVQKEVWFSEAASTLGHAALETPGLLVSIRDSTSPHAADLGLLLRAAERDHLTLARVEDTVRYLQRAAAPQTPPSPPSKRKGTKTGSAVAEELPRLPRNPFGDSGSSWGLPALPASDET